MKKKLAIVCLLILFGLTANAQEVVPVFNYTHPTKSELYKLATSGTIKGNVYLDYLVDVINLGLKDTTLKVSVSDTSFIFSHLFKEEVYLKRGEYMNSGYSESQKKMIPSLGHKEGWSFQWVFRVGTFNIVLIKDDCGNILNVPVVRIFNDDPPAVSSSVDTIKIVERIQKNIPLNVEINITNNNVYNYPQPILPTPAVKKKRGIVGVLTGIGVLIITGIIYLLTHVNHGGDGGPGGTPTTPGIPTPGGGPGGTPTTP